MIDNGYACIPTNPDDTGITLPYHITTTVPPMQSCMPPPNTASIFIGTGVVLTTDNGFQKADPVGMCINSPPNGITYYYNGETKQDYSDDAGAVWVGQWIRTGCLMPCVCTSSACYIPDPGNPSPDPNIFLYPHCTTANQCFLALVFVSSGSIVNPMDSMDAFDAKDQTINDVNDLSYPKVESIGCNGCPVLT
uniref:Uncharacterized protein n=1 Tax=Panagrolaimus sp. ES5 TaxID=591445 RepID=A0AC34FX38_9BILA